MAEEIGLSRQHLIIWNAIRGLKDGERIRGEDLRRLTGISLRNFYVIIEELQAAGYYIGASRSDDQGYYEIRTNSDMAKFLQKKRNELQRKWNALDEFEKKWLEEHIDREDEEIDEE